MKKYFVVTLSSLALMMASVAKAAETVTVSGSTSVTGLMEVLAERYQNSTGNTVEVQGTGSSAGVRAANQGTSHIGMSSREVQASELNGDVETFILAMDGIAVVAHPSNGVKNLSREQLKKVFIGELTNWKQLGGANMPIVAITREVGSGTRGAFESIMGLTREINGHKVTAISPRAQVQSGNGAIKTQVANNPAALGYISLGSVDASVSALAVDNAVASAENIASGAYPIARPFVLMLKQPVAPSTQTYIDFMRSDAGSAIIDAQGYISLK